MKCQVCTMAILPFETNWLGFKCRKWIKITEMGKSGIIANLAIPAKLPSMQMPELGQTGCVGQIWHRG